jgi:hypothetical protein
VPYLSAAGNVQFSAAGMINVEGLVADSQGYTLSAANGIVLNAEGMLEAGGTINGNLSNEGRIELGLGATSLTVNGNYSQAASGTLLIHLLDATTFGQLLVTGTASLDGTLTVQADNGFTPVPGEQFVVLNYGSVSGDFRTENLSLGGGYSLSPFYSASALTLTVKGPGGGASPGGNGGHGRGDSIYLVESGRPARERWASGRLVCLDKA